MTAQRRDILGVGVGAAAAKIIMSSSGVHAAETPRETLRVVEHLILTDPSTGDVLVGPLLEDQSTGDVIFESVSLHNVPLLEDEDDDIHFEEEEDGVFTSEELNLSDISTRTITPSVEIIAKRDFVDEIRSLLAESTEFSLSPPIPDAPVLDARVDIDAMNQGIISGTILDRGSTQCITFRASILGHPAVQRGLEIIGREVTAKGLAVAVGLIAVGGAALAYIALQLCARAARSLCANRGGVHSFQSTQSPTGGFMCVVTCNR